MSMKAYPQYRDSGVEWLGEVPMAWKVTPLRYLADIETGSKDTVNADPAGDYPFYVRSQTPLAIQSYSYDCEAILTPGDGDVGNIFHHVYGRFDVHQRVYVLKRFREVHTRFLYYYLASQFIKVVEYGGAKTTVASLRRPMFTSFQVVAGSFQEQVAIASYLDRETAEIDAFITDQEELVGLLYERRTATITAMTFPDQEPESLLSIRSNPPALVRIGQAFLESNARAGSASVSDLLSVSIHSGVRLWREMHDKEPKAADLGNYKVVKTGDIVLNRMRAFQGGLGEAKFPGVVSPDYMVMRIRSTADSKYLAYLMKSQRFVSEMSARLRGIGSEEQGAVRTPRINPRDLADILVPLPTLGEQQAIAAYLDQEIGEIDAAIADAKDAIELSKERRSALISAAVTGKIDVRDNVFAEGEA
jgi:type I restriction enzyme S subunit